MEVQFTTKSNIDLIDHPTDLLRRIDKNLLVEILVAFTNATGLTANIVSPNGVSIFSKSDAQKNCKFCRLIRDLERGKGVKRCTGAYQRAGRQAAMYREPYIFRCPAGLIEWIAPIVVDDIHIGSIICGQVLMWEPEEFFWIELEQMNRELTDDIEPLIEAAKELQVVSAEKVQASSKLLGIVSTIIVKTLWDEVLRAKEFEYQQDLLAEEIKTRQSLEKKLNANSLTYYYDQEKWLVSTLKMGDFEEVRKIFVVIVADVLKDYPDLAQAKTRIFELFVALSRTAVEMKVDPNKTIEINTNFMKVSRMASNIETLGEISFNTLEEYLSNIKQKSQSSKQSIEDIKGYIRSHHQNVLTLKEIADSVSLSPYYASRIFKEDQGITIMEYATTVKMEEAKMLLANPKHKVEEIAGYLGYADPSYFTRVFKKTVGLTPSQYRLNN